MAPPGSSRGSSKGNSDNRLARTSGNLLASRHSSTGTRIQPVPAAWAAVRCGCWVAAPARRDSALARRDLALTRRDLVLARRDSDLARRDLAPARRDSVLARG